MITRFLASLALVVSNSFAQDDLSHAAEESQAAYKSYLSELIGENPYQEGDIDLPGGVVRLHLPDKYRFLPSSETKKVLVDLWGNPPEAAEGTWGMVIPAGQSLETPGSWTIIVEFTEDGYVSDDDADEIDYPDLLRTIQENAREANESRREQGYGGMEVVGWAVEPHYDKERRVLHWAKELAFEGETENTLNYDVRVLGRRGVLNMQGVAKMSAVAEIRESVPSIVDMVEFLPGHRYSDFDPKTDKESGMSLAGMVVGGAVAAKLAAKAGFIAKLGLILAKGWKAILLLVFGVLGFFKRLAGRGETR